MKELKRNPDTGVVEVWEDGKKVGEIRTMGDEIMGNPNGRSGSQDRR